MLKYLEILAAITGTIWLVWLFIVVAFGAAAFIVTIRNR